MFSFKKVGAIRFVKLGRVGFSFWVAKKPGTKTVRVPLSSKAFSGDCWAFLRQEARTARDNRAAIISGLNQVNAMLALANIAAALVVTGVI